MIPARVVHKQGTGVGIAFHRSEPAFDSRAPRAPRF
jgi:hypothetical protein